MISEGISKRMTTKEQKIEELVECVAEQLYSQNGKNDKPWSYWSDDGDTKSAHRNKAKQILNLKGDGWKIAILGKPFEIGPSGLVDGKVDRITIPNVIWEAGEE